MKPAELVTPPSDWRPPKYSWDYARRVLIQIERWHVLLGFDPTKSSKLTLQPKLTCMHFNSPPYPYTSHPRTHLCQNEVVWWSPISDDKYCEEHASEGFRGSCFRVWTLTRYMQFLDSKELLERYIS